MPTHVLSTQPIRVQPAPLTVRTLRANQPVRFGSHRQHSDGAPLDELVAADHLEVVDCALVRDFAIIVPSAAKTRWWTRMKPLPPGAAETGGCPCAEIVLSFRRSR